MSEDVQLDIDSMAILRRGKILGKQKRNTMDRKLTKLVIIPPTLNRYLMQSNWITIEENDIYVLLRELDIVMNIISGILDRLNPGKWN